MSIKSELSLEIDFLYCRLGGLFGGLVKIKRAIVDERDRILREKKLNTSDSAYIASFPTERFNYLYNSAYKVANKINETADKINELCSCG